MAQSPFETLGLPVRFDLDRSEIEQAFLARVAQAHPDLAGNDGAADPAALNDARRVLLDDEQRARAVMSLRGPHAEAPPLSPEFLQEILDVRQQAEEAIESGDAGEIGRWRQWAADRRAELRSKLSPLLGAGDGPLQLDAARQASDVLQQWRYFERMLEQVGVPERAPDA